MERNRERQKRYRDKEVVIGKSLVLDLQKENEKLRKKNDLLIRALRETYLSKGKCVGDKLYGNVLR